VLAAFTGVTLAGYVILYTDASGKFCTARFDQHMQLGVYIWTGFTGVTLAMLVVTAILRGLSRHLSNTTNLLTGIEEAGSSGAQNGRSLRLRRSP